MCDVPENAGRGPIASWDCESGQWLDANGMNGDLFGQSEPFSGTWPTSGSMRNGVLSARTTPEAVISASGCSSSGGLLPTPAAGNFNDGEDLESWEARRQRNLAKGINGNGQGTPLAIAAQQLLPTPRATDWKDQVNKYGERTPPENAARRGRALPEEARAMMLLKTPTAQLAVNGGSQDPVKRKAGGHGPTLADQVEHDLLPTPAARDWKSGQSNLIGTNARPLVALAVGEAVPGVMAADGGWTGDQNGNGARASARASGCGTPAGKYRVGKL